VQSEVREAPAGVADRALKNNSDIYQGKVQKKAIPAVSTLLEAISKTLDHALLKEH